MRLSPGVVLLALCMAAMPALALSVDELDVNTGLLLIGNTEPAPSTGTSPIVTLVGVSLPLRIAGPFFIEPALELFGTTYEWTGTRAVPAAVEAGPGFFTLGVLVSVHAGLQFAVAPTLWLGGSLALDFLFRVPLELANTNADSITGRGFAPSYFFGQGRFFYPETRLFLKWKVSDSLGLRVNLRALYPLFHAWDGEALPFFDQLMLAGGLGFAISLPAAPSK
jgi:hypothetical protein